MALIEQILSMGLDIPVQLPSSIGVFLLAFIILVAGGLLAGRLSGGRFVSRRYDFLDGHGDHTPLKKLYIHPFENDEFGVVGERVVGQLRREFSGFWNGSGHFLSKLEIGKGHAGVSRVSDETGSEDPFQEASILVDGCVVGRRLTINFTDESFESEGYSCADFPLLSLGGLSIEMTHMHRMLFGLAVMAKVARNFRDGSERFFSEKLIRGYGERLAKSALQVRLTQGELAGEMEVAAGWCYLQLGLHLGRLEDFETALMHYDNACEFNWLDRCSPEWAGIKANRAAAGLGVGGRVETPHSYCCEVQADVKEALRFFRFDCDQEKAGALYVVSAFALRLAGSAGLSQNERVRVLQGLERSIEYWHDRRDDKALARAYLAQGGAAFNAAKTHLGVHDWERAENALLSGLAATTRIGVNDSGMLEKVQFELSQLYLIEAVRFGDVQLLEKAKNYLTHLKGRAKRLNPQLDERVQISLALCHLNLGGIRGERLDLIRAARQFNDIRDKIKSRGLRREIDRYICVARARLALISHERGEINLAISQISAVAGYGVQKWPTRDVLLRLRARLRELQFVFEGDDVALDRAIMDRRRLVEMAGDGALSLRFAVEAGDLVGLLSRRQYKLDEKAHDFHEAHYLLERALEVCSRSGLPAALQAPRFDISFIQAGLHLKMAKLLASFARVKRDETALSEAVVEYDAFLELTPRSADGLARAAALNEIGQIMMDRSEHYGHHVGLVRAAYCFAEAYDLYLQLNHLDQANRQRRFFENAEAAIMAYNVPYEDNGNGLTDSGARAGLETKVGSDAGGVVVHSLLKK